jgi:aerobic carbon-monoxide dehydrogenase large subunit
MNNQDNMFSSQSYVGKSSPRQEIQRLMQGQGTYVDDIQLPKMLHLAFVRSPYAFASISKIDCSQATNMPGVVRIFTGHDINKLCKPYKGIISHLEGMKAVFQTPLATDKAYWNGHPVVAVVAETRSQAEDAAENIFIDWQELVPIVNENEALKEGTPVIHPELGTNLCWQKNIDCPEIEDVFKTAHTVVESRVSTGRHTHVTLEPRSILVDYRTSDQQLTIWQSTQVPHMMQIMIAEIFSLPHSQIRVVAPDVGGSFGLKIHIYGDEMAAIAIALDLGRPIKFIADRLESFLSDYHSRDHQVWAKLALAQDGKILALEMDDLQSMGAFTGFPRGSINEARQIINLAGGAYDIQYYQARTRVAYQNKSMYGQYRSVGHPVACLVTENLIELAAKKMGIDSLELRKNNYISSTDYPKKLKSGVVIENLSQHEALEKLKHMMDYSALREEQAYHRSKNIYRGIGIASFLEMSNPSSATYGKGGVAIAALDTALLRLMPDGTIFCTASINEFGQGAATIARQIVAQAIGLDLEKIRVSLGDTDIAPYGGDNWGSRGAGVGGEAIFQTAQKLRKNIIEFAAKLLNFEIESLGIKNNQVIDISNQCAHISLEELARIAYFNPEKSPHGYFPEFTVSHSYAQKTYDGICTNGIQASYLEVDPQIGKITLLNHWVVEDCGTVINPLLVDEQVRGGVVQGIGAALYEQCIYSKEGQLINGSLMDYLVPMAYEMPDIIIGHTYSPTKSSQLGAKGAGEAGVAGSAAAIFNAVNDALNPLNALISAIPITPENIIQAVLHAQERN